MKIIFFSDIHGNKYVLPPLLNAIKKEKSDQIIFCGDIFGYYYYQNEIIDCFKKNNFITLLGNHDQYFLDILNENINIDNLINKYGNSYKDIKNKITKENVQFLKKLKPNYEFKADNYNIGVFHGSPDDPLEGRIYPDTKIEQAKNYEHYNYVILGHTHHKMEKKVQSTIILNPGSIGQQRDGKGCSYLILDTKKNKYEFKTIKFAINKLIQDIDIYDQGNSKLKEVLLRKASLKDNYSS
jgi:putative phosphoesterase